MILVFWFKKQPGSHQCWPNIPTC